MASPKLQRSRRPTDYLEDSNSTASLFLGGVRKNWMASASVSATAETAVNPREARTTAMAAPNPAKSPTAPPPARAVTKGINRPEPEFVELPRGLMSPVTPGANLQSATSISATSNTAPKPDPPPITTALPSPVPSPASHQNPDLAAPSTTPSIEPPAVATGAVSPPSDSLTPVTSRSRPPKNASLPDLLQQLFPPLLSPPSAQNQSPRLQIPSRPAESSEISESSASASSAVPHTTNPGSQPLQVITDGIQVQSLQNKGASRQNLPTEQIFTSSRTPGGDAVGTPIQHSTPTLPASPGLNSPTLNVWKTWKACANGLLEHAKAFSPNIGAPRALLLSNACDHQDLFYLLLHQIFCEMSRDASGTLAKLPALGDDRHQQGFAPLADLLEHNSKLPSTLLSAFCAYPSRLEDLMSAPWFWKIFGEVLSCLSGLTTQFSSMQIETQRVILERGYPPLVTEMQQVYGTTSPVLLGVIFMSICRHVYEPERIDLLQRIFRKNLFLVLRTPAHPKAEQSLIEQYQRVPMRAAFAVTSPRIPRPVTQNQRPMGSPQSGAPARHSHSAASSPVVNTSATASPALPASGQRSPAYPSPHIQSPNMPPGAQISQRVQYLDQNGHPISSSQARQMTQQVQAHLAQNQGQAQPPTPVLLQPVTSAHGQGQNVQTGLVYMVMDSASNTWVPVTNAPPSLNYSSFSPSQQAMSGWPGHVVQQQQTQYPQQFEYPLQPHQQFRPQQQQQQQPPQPRHLPPTGYFTHFSATDATVQMSVMGRTSHSRARAPPQVRPVPTSSPVVQVPQSQASHSNVSPATPLLPPEGYRPPLTVQPNPLRLSLHQADLRDPVKQLVRQTAAGFEETDLYQYLDGFLLSPTQIDPDVFQYHWKFTISAEEYQRFPRHADRGDGLRSIRTFQPGCRTYRLRMVALPDSQKEKLQTFWSTANTTWPSVLYVFVNDNEMYVRRKLHNGKDLPLDITRHLREGHNEVNVHLLLGPGECKNSHYAVGIETMAVSEYSSVLSKIRRCPASETRANIKKRLTATTNDDELAVVTDSLTIPLIDPFMAQIFMTPTRSIHCNHIECFDLETFITTRKSQSGPTPMIDNWLCPICKADARPQQLLVDEFFVQVRDELKREGYLETAQSIQVRADGSWTVKIVRDSASPSSPTRRRSSQAVPSGKRKADSMTGTEEPHRAKLASPSHASALEAEIIELD